MSKEEWDELAKEFWKDRLAFFNSLFNEENSCDKRTPISRAKCRENWDSCRSEVTSANSIFEAFYNSDGTPEAFDAALKKGVDDINIATSANGKTEKAMNLLRIVKKAITSDIGGALIEPHLEKLNIIVTTLINNVDKYSGGLLSNVFFAGLYSFLDKLINKIDLKIQGEKDEKKKNTLKNHIIKINAIKKVIKTLTTTAADLSIERLEERMDNVESLEEISAALEKATTEGSSGGYRKSKKRKKYTNKRKPKKLTKRNTKKRYKRSKKRSKRKSRNLNY